MGALLNGLTGGLAGLANLPAVALLVLGTFVGLMFGVVPGLGGIVLLVIMLPFLYNMSPILGLTLLLGSHSAIYYASSTTAILLNTPGAPESAATCFDGYAMTQKGHVARALGISAAATAFGGWFGAIVLVAAIPLMLFFVTLFHPPEYFFLTLLAVVLIGQLQAGSTTKGILSGALGFMLAFVGDAPSTGTTRFTFGNLSLYQGFPVAVVAIGLFALSQMFILYGSGHEVAVGDRPRLARENWSEVWQGICDVFGHLWLTIRSAAIGTICGIIPGIGSTAANFLSYGQAMRISKHPELFGTGIPEGIIAPEASSISKEAGALIPTVALGIPNGPAMAVLISAFGILGLNPGPTMLTNHLPLVFSLVWVLAISSLLGSVIGLAVAPLLARISTVPGRVLVPFVFTLTMIGAFATTTDILQVFALVFFGVVGLLMKRFQYSLPAVIVGVVLGSTAENNLILTSQIYGWSFLERPLTIAIILAIVAVIVSGSRGRGRETARQRSAGAALPRLAPAELVLDALWVVVSGVYFVISLSFHPPSNIAPALISAAVFVTGVLQLVGVFVPRWRVATHGPGLGEVLGARPAGAMPEAPLPLPHTAAEVRSDVAAAEAGPAAAGALATSGMLGSEVPGQWLGVALAVALYVGILLFGFVLGVTLFIACYFLFVRRMQWWGMIISAASVGALTYGVFTDLLGVLPPPGLVTHLLGG
jgi:putative tricarboxylic transport membrane protein